MSKKSKFQLLFSNTIVFAIGSFLTKLIMLLLMPLYTSNLTTEQYGIAELLNNLIEVLLPIATLCIIDAVFRFSIDDNADFRGLLSTAIDILLKSYVVLLFLFIIYYKITGYEYTFYFYLLYISATIHKLFSQFARGRGLIKKFAVSGVINAISLVTMNIILLVFLKAGINGYLISLIVSHLIAGVYSFFTSKAHHYIDLKATNKILLKSMLFFSLPNIPNMLSWWVNNISSRYIILGFCGAGVAGMFTAASKLPSMINLLTTLFQQAWQYSSSKEINNKDNGKFFSDVFKYYSTFVFIACSTLIMISPYISKVILKGDFFEARVYVPLLLFSATLGCFSVFFGTFYTAVKNNVMAMFSTGVGAITNMTLNFLFVPTMGVFGALFASVCGYSLITVIRMIDTQKYVSIKVNYVSIVFQFMLMFIQALSLSFIGSHSYILSIFSFIVIIAINLRSICNILRLIHKSIVKKKTVGWI